MNKTIKIFLDISKMVDVEVASGSSISIINYFIMHLLLGFGLYCFYHFLLIKFYNYNTENLLTEISGLGRKKILSLHINPWNPSIFSKWLT